MKKCTFYNFFNRHSGCGFDTFLSNSKEDIDYINWNGYCLPMTYGETRAEYTAVRNTCELFGASPVKKYKIPGKDAAKCLFPLRRNMQMENLMV